MMASEMYARENQARWPEITERLITEHPLNVAELRDTILKCWEDILSTSIANKFRIGVDIKPKPQIMGFLLHELISLSFEQKHPTIWRREATATDKDMIYIPDDRFSIEIKTSSSDKNIYGNRSYAQEGSDHKKSKSGYYLAVNFEKFDNKGNSPRINLIRFGWLDHADWIGQAAATGQQARLSPEIELTKLKSIFSMK